LFLAFESWLVASLVSCAGFFLEGGGNREFSPAVKVASIVSDSMTEGLAGWREARGMELLPKAGYPSGLMILAAGDTSSGTETDKASLS